MTERERRVEELGERFVDGQRELHEGSAERAAAIFEELAVDWAAFDGPDCERALTMRGFLGRALTDARRFSEAEAVLAALMIDRARVFGPDDEQTLVARGNLMRAIAFGGRPREAIVMAERLVEDRTRIYGPDDVSVHRMRGHIARFHLELSDFAEASAQYAQVLEAFERLGLDDTYEFAEMSYNGAVADAKAAPTAESVAAFAEMVDDIEADLGPDDPWTLTAKATLAELLAFYLGDYGRAVPIYFAVLDREVALWGAGAVETLVTRRALARCLIGLDRSGEAVATLEDGVAAGAATGYANEIGGLHTRMDLIWARMELVARLAAFEDRGEVVDAEIARQFEAAVEEYRALEADSRSLEPDHPLRRAILNLAVDHGLDAA